MRQKIYTINDFEQANILGETIGKPRIEQKRVQKNKNVVLFFLRENTNLNTKEIRVYLKKYKTLYVETLRKINNEY